LPSGYELQTADRADGHWWVLGNERAGQHGGAPTRLWIFDAEWQLVGEVQGLLPAQPYEMGPIYPVWHPDGRRLAVKRVEYSTPAGAHGAQRARLSVGVVTPDNLEFRPLHVWDGVRYPELVSHLAWTGDRLVVSYAVGDGDRVDELDPRTGAVREVLTEHGRAVPGDCIWDLLPSPDGRLVALNRLGYARQSGVSVLDVLSGDCSEITSEAGQAYYYHLPVEWEAPRVLRFMRRAEDGTFEYYRLFLPERLLPRASGRPMSTTTRGGRPGLSTRMARE
jgi:hypothetical protein